MRCPFCMEDIADNSEKCSLCNSEIVIPCPFCMEKIQAGAMKCKHCGSMLNSSQPQQTPPQPQYQQPSPAFQHVVQQQTLPPGITGWSWGAALLTWIWAIGNKVWIGLLAIVPGINIVMFFVLGIKGREWAWKNGQWESVDHFNRVQKKWSQWAVGLTLVGFVLGVVGAIAMPQFNAYKTKGNNAAALSSLKNLKTTLESNFADKQVYPESLETSGYKIPDDVYMKCSMNPVGYVCVSAHKNGTKMYVIDNGNAKVDEQSYISGSPVQVPYDPPMTGSAKAGEYLQNQSDGQVQPDATQQQFKYYQPVTLSGVLKSGMGIDANENKVSYPSIQLAAPITVNGNPNDDDESLRETEKDIIDIQLVLNDQLMAKYKSLKGITVTVSCSDLYHQITGHHFTKVLCTVKDIN